MAAITTSTANSPAFTNAFGYPPNSMMDINVVTGHLWIVFKDLSNRGAVWKSTDGGASWSFQHNFTVSGNTIEDIQEMRIDPAGEQIHMVLLVNNGSAEAMHYKRLDISSGSVAGATGSQIFSGPAGTSQSLIYSSACVPVKNPDGSYHIFLACSQHNGSTSGVRVYAVTVKNDAAKTTYVNDAIIGPTREWRASGDDTSMTVCLDVEHNGDGITSATPNVWVTWLMNTTLYAVRCTWKGYRAGWQTPPTAAVVGTGRVTERDAVGRWDGSRFVIASVYPGNQAQIQVIERNASNTINSAIRTSPSHPGGSIVGARMMSYNHITKDVRLFAVQASGASPIWYVDYIRATDSWGSWTNTGFTSPLVSEWGVRRGTYGTAQYDLYLETGASSPWTISSAAMAVNFTPTAPTWLTGVAGAVVQNGAAFDVALNLTLDWEFHDPNSSDTQSAYALQRQIGVASAQWWRASDSTWQSSETWNSTSTTSVVLTPANWVGGGGASDLAHVYKVATKDGSGAASAYSVGLALVPSTRVDPTVTAPTANTILNTGTVAVTWTVTEQSQWRVQILPLIVSDSFSRTTSNGFGTADSGAVWTITGATPNSDYSVSTGSGRLAIPANASYKEVSLASITAQDVNLYLIGVQASAAPTGSFAVLDVKARVIDAANFVHLRVFFNPGVAPSVVVASVEGNTETFLSSFATPNGSVAPQGPVNLRFVAVGGMLYGRMWSGTEPTEWHVSCPTTLLSAGGIAVGASTNTGNSNTKPYSLSAGDVIVSDATLTTYDSGWTTDPLPLSPATLAHTPPTVFQDGYQGVVNVQTKNGEGLASQLQAVPFTIDFVEPVTPTVTTAAAPASGGINVTVTQSAPSGSQPTTDRIDVYRREVASGSVLPANANPYFETNATDWTNSGYSTVARSTAQFHSGAASLLLTPNGSTATPKVQTTALYAAVTGTRWEFRGWLRSTTANKTMRIYIDWYDNTPTLLGSTVRDLTPVATTWLYAWVRGTAPVGCTQARIAIGQLATPAAGDTLYGDELGLYAANDDNGIPVFRSVTVGTANLDWRAVTGVDYEYQGYAVATNGTVSYGPWV